MAPFGALVLLRAVCKGVGTRTGDAKLGYDWDGEREHDEPHMRRLAEALVDALAVDVEVAEKLADAPVQDPASDDGLVYAWEFDFSDTRVDQDVLEHIQEKRGSPQVRFEPNFFEGIEEY